MYMYFYGERTYSRKAFTGRRTDLILQSWKICIALVKRCIGRLQDAEDESYMYGCIKVLVQYYMHG